MNIAEIQQQIFNETGIKTSVKKLSGSMKHYIRISSMFQGGKYPQFDIDYRRNFVKQFKTVSDCGNYYDAHGFDILKINFEDLEPMKYKTERKPKPLEENEPFKGWGSKNSQLRLDKATARYAKKLRSGNGHARYY